MPLSNFRRTAVRLALLCAALGAAGTAHAQYRGGGPIRVLEGTDTQRAVGTRNLLDTPEWKNPVGFEKDVFTFTRLQYGSNRGFFGGGDGGGGGGRRGGGSGGGDWTTDLPDADLNLAYRLQQMTSMKTDPDGRIVKATDPRLGDYPFLFAAAPNAMVLNSAEVTALRKYLLNGGFLLMSDFHGATEWNHVQNLFKQILPDHNFVELPLDHPLYKNSVFPITSKGQVPNQTTGFALQAKEGAPDEFDPYNTVEWRHDGGDVEEVHHRAILDSKGRIMVLAIHNSDVADGWEREGENDYYFHRFSEKIAYPLAVNIIYYVMTH